MNVIWGKSKAQNDSFSSNSISLCEAWVCMSVYLNIYRIYCVERNSANSMSHLHNHNHGQIDMAQQTFRNGLVALILTYQANSPWKAPTSSSLRKRYLVYWISLLTCIHRSPQTQIRKWRLKENEIRGFHNQCSIRFTMKSNN